MKSLVPFGTFISRQDDATPVTYFSLNRRESICHLEVPKLQVSKFETLSLFQDGETRTKRPTTNKHVDTPKDVMLRKTHGVCLCIPRCLTASAC
jgi:hypothetical protein